MTDEEKVQLHDVNEKIEGLGPMPVYYDYFCGEPEDTIIQQQLTPEENNDGQI